MADHGSIASWRQYPGVYIKVGRFLRRASNRVIRVEAAFPVAADGESPDLRWRYYLRAQLWNTEHPTCPRTSENQLPPVAERRTLGVIAMNPASAMRGPDRWRPEFDGADPTVTRILNFFEHKDGGDLFGQFHVVELVNCYPVFAPTASVLSRERTNGDVEGPLANMEYVSEMFRRSDMVMVATGTHRVVQSRMDEITSLPELPEQWLFCTRTPEAPVPDHFGNRREYGTLVSVDLSRVRESLGLPETVPPAPTYGAEDGEGLA